MASQPRIPWVGFRCEWCWHAHIFLQRRDATGVVLASCEQCRREAFIVFHEGQPPETFKTLAEACDNTPQLVEMLRSYIQPWTRTRWSELHARS